MDIYHDGNLVIETIQLYMVHPAIAVKEDEVAVKEGGDAVKDVSVNRDAFIITKFKHVRREFLDKNIYVLNIFCPETQTVNQVLMKICNENAIDDFIVKLRKQSFFIYNDFSANPITFDVYSEEGLINV